MAFGSFPLLVALNKLDRALCQYKQNRDFLKEYISDSPCACITAAPPRLKEFTHMLVQHQILGPGSERGAVLSSVLLLIFSLPAQWGFDWGSRLRPGAANAQSCAAERHQRFEVHENKETACHTSL